MNQRLNRDELVLCNVIIYMKGYYKRRREDMIELVKEVISKNIGVNRDSISDNADLIEELGIDSLDLVNIVSDLEEESGVEITDEMYLSLRTVQQIADCLDENQRLAI